jgi:hypothetical protein
MGKLVTPLMDFVDTVITAETPPMTKAWKYGLVVSNYLALLAFLTLVAGFSVSMAAAGAGLSALLMALIVVELY